MSRKRKVPKKTVIREMREIVFEHGFASDRAYLGHLLVEVTSLKGTTGLYRLLEEELTESQYSALFEIMYYNQLQKQEEDKLKEIPPEDIALKKRIQAKLQKKVG